MINDLNNSTYTEKEPETESEIIQEIQVKFDEAHQYRKQFEADWIEYERFYDGKQWRMSDRRIVLNQIFKTIEYEVPILTDRRPGTDFVAIEEDRQDDAKLLKEAVDYVYADQVIDMKVVKGVRSMLKTGMAYMYVDYDPDGEEGQGSIIVRGLPWRQVFLDPSTDELDAMSYVLFRIPEKVKKLKRMFPTIADKIKPEDIDQVDYTRTEEWLREDRYHGPGFGIEGYFKPTDMAYIYEYWRKDYTMEPIPQEVTAEEADREFQMLVAGQIPEVSRYQDHATLAQFLDSKRQEIISQFQLQAAALNLPENAVYTDNDMVLMQLIEDLIQQHQAMLQKNPDGERPKYPNFMRLTIKICNSIAYDGPPDVQDGLYPIAPIYGYMEEGRPYASGEIKNIIDCQKAINQLNWAEHQDLQLGTNTGWILDDASGVDEKSLTNERGIVITKKQGTEVTRIPPAQVSPNLSNKIGFYIQETQFISGITEAAQGTRPVGVTAAKAITALQEQALVRIRLKERQLAEYTMKRLGQLVAARIVKYWTKERILRVYDDSGRIKSVNFDPSRLYDLKYMVRISPGTTFGLTNEAINEYMKELLQLGVIDPKMMVQASEIPYKGQILQQLEERDQLTQQAQALAQENAMLNDQLNQLGSVLTASGATHGQTHEPQMMPNQPPA